MSSGDRSRGKRLRRGECRPPDAYSERVARYRRGRWSEVAAALLLTAKGYRILAWRQRTAFGEIDLIALRGRRLAFVEVKHRASLEEAETSLTVRQQDRIARAAAAWTSRHPRFCEHEQGLDVILVVPRRLPVHRINAFMASDRRCGHPD